jgi:catechol 2,3-dioxygenase-like lactoylglutathione lyase family enzyme
MARSIHHVDLTVSDLTRSRTFYEPIMRYLGYELTRQAPREVVFSPVDRCADTSVRLYAAKPGSRGKRHDRYAPGLHHLAFEAESREDVDGLHLLLRELNAVILDPPGVYYPAGYYALFFADPDGLKLELAFTPGSLPARAASGQAKDAVLRKIDCVMVKVENLAAARRFYERVLGLTHLWSNTHSIALGMRDSDAEIVLHDDPEIPRECNVHYLVGDVKEAAAKLSSAGCSVMVAPFEVRVGMCAVLRDPFENLLNLIDMSKGPSECGLREER